jgi:hypothetical protein
MRRNSSSRSGETWWPVGGIPDGIYFRPKSVLDSGFCHGGNVLTSRPIALARIFVVLRSNMPQF